MLQDRRGERRKEEEADVAGWKIPQNPASAADTCVLCRKVTQVASAVISLLGVHVEEMKNQPKT